MKNVAVKTVENDEALLCKRGRRCACVLWFLCKSKLCNSHYIYKNVIPQVSLFLNGIMQENNLSPKVKQKLKVHLKLQLSMTTIMYLITSFPL